VIVDLSGTGSVRDVRRLKRQKLALFPIPPWFKFDDPVCGDSVRISGLTLLPGRKLGWWGPLSHGEDLVILAW